MLSAAGLISGTLILFGIALIGASLINTLPTSMSVPYGVWPVLLTTWVLLGIAYSAVQTPTGPLLRRSAQAGDRPVLFAAQFALSHACWLLSYPLAGWLGLAAVQLSRMLTSISEFAGIPSGSGPRPRSSLDRSAPRYFPSIKTGSTRFRELVRTCEQVQY